MKFRRTHSSRLVVAVLMLLLTSTPGVFERAAAYDTSGNTANTLCEDRTLGWSFTHDPPTAAIGDAVEAGFNEWEHELDDDGKPLLEVGRSEDVSGVLELAWKVNFSPRPGYIPFIRDSLLGITACWPLNTITLNETIVDPAEMQDIARHELGHAFRMDHSGRYDSWDGQWPTMSTCVGGTQREMRQDDEGAANFFHQEDGSLFPNWGFERDGLYWHLRDPDGDSTAFISATDAHHGKRSYWFEYGDTGDYLWQRMRLTTAADDTLYARASFKHYQSNDVHGGSAWLRIYERPIEWPVDTECIQPATGKNQNNQIVNPNLQFVQMTDDHFDPGTDWKNVDALEELIVSGEGDGVDVELRIHSSLRTTGTSPEPIPLGIDNARIRGGQ